MQKCKKWMSICGGNYGKLDGVRAKIFLKTKEVRSPPPPLPRRQIQTMSVTRRVEQKHKDVEHIVMCVLKTFFG